jgi:hypothetical protein
MSPLYPPWFQERPRFSDGWQSQSVLAARLRARKPCRAALIANTKPGAAWMAKSKLPLAVVVFVVAVSPAPTLVLSRSLAVSVRVREPLCRVAFRRVSRGSYRAAAALPSEAQPCGRPRSLRSLDAAR